MCEAYPEIERLGAGALGVGTGADFQARRLMEEGLRGRAVPFPLLVDPDANLYRALDIGRVGWSHWLRRDVAARYVRAWRAGSRPGRVTGDARRLSGVAIVDPDRRLRYLHRSAAVGDYPSIDETLAALRELSP
ncbi:MAG TPA: peroxiredoxin-like family protein [Acidimicrobiia bacterium]